MNGTPAGHPAGKRGAGTAARDGFQTHPCALRQKQISRAQLTRHARHGHGTRFPGLSIAFSQPAILRDVKLSLLLGIIFPHEQFMCPGRWPCPQVEHVTNQSMVTSSRSSMMPWALKIVGCLLINCLSGFFKTCCKGFSFRRKCSFRHQITQRYFVWTPAKDCSPQMVAKCEREVAPKPVGGGGKLILRVSSAVRGGHSCRSSPVSVWWDLSQMD